MLRLYSCKGYRKDGRKCTRVLAELDLAPGSVVRILCRSCDTLNVFQVPECEHALVGAVVSVLHVASAM